MAGAAQRERQHQRDQEDAESVVPVEELKAIVLNPLESVGPGAPADSTGNHHEQGNTKTLRCEHDFSLKCSSGRDLREKRKPTQPSPPGRHSRVVIGSYGVLASLAQVSAGG